MNPAAPTTISGISTCTPPAPEPLFLGMNDPQVILLTGILAALIAFGES